MAIVIVACKRRPGGKPGVGAKVERLTQSDWPSRTTRFDQVVIGSESLPGNSPPNMITSSDSSQAVRKPSNERKISVLLVEDHQVLRDSLTVLLKGAGDIVVQDAVATAGEALQKLSRDIDLVILDISLPDRDGIWLTRKIKALYPRLPVLVLTMHEGENFVISALEAGVDGYLTKWAGQQELLRAIRAVARDGSYLQTRIAPLVVQALRRREARRRTAFSDREHEIAKCLVNGLSNSEIAERIRLSVSTVKSDLRSLYSKLEVSGRSEAVAAVVEKGIAHRD